MREALSYQIQRIMNLRNNRMLTASSFHAWNAMQVVFRRACGGRAWAQVQTLAFGFQPFLSVFYVFTCSLQKIVGNTAKKLKPTNMNLVMLFVMQVCDA